MVNIVWRIPGHLWHDVTCIDTLRCILHSVCFKVEVGLWAARMILSWGSRVKTPRSMSCPTWVDTQDSEPDLTVSCLRGLAEKIFQTWQARKKCASMQMPKLLARNAIMAGTIQIANDYEQVFKSETPHWNTLFAHVWSCLYHGLCVFFNSLPTYTSPFDVYQGVASMASSPGPDPLDQSLQFSCRRSPCSEDGGVPLRRPRSSQWGNERQSYQGIEHASLSKANRSIVLRPIRHTFHILGSLRENMYDCVVHEHT